MSKKFTIEEMKEYVENNSSCKLISKEYINNKTKMDFLCECGKPFKSSFSGFKLSKSKKCPSCAMDMVYENQRFKYEDVKKYINSFGVELLSTEYINSGSKLELRCKECGEIYYQSFSGFKFYENKICNNCVHKITAKKNLFSYAYIKNYIETNTNLKLLSTEYLGYEYKLELLCECGKAFETSFNAIKSNNKSSCNECAIINNKRNIKKRENKYNYEYVRDYINLTGNELLSTEYINGKDKLKIKCKCGKTYYKSFTQFKYTKLKNCPSCSRESAGKGRAFSYEYIKNYINSTGNTLLSTEYINNHTELLIKCRMCGEEYSVTFNNFADSKTFKFACKHCASKIGAKDRTFSLDYVTNFIKDNGCELISKEYKQSNEKLKIKCNCGDVFETSFHRFSNYNKRQCNKCGNKITGNKLKKKFKDVKHYIESFNNNILITEENNWKGRHSILNIKCNCGEIFKLSYIQYKDSIPKKCPSCSSKISSYEKIVQRVLESLDIKFSNEETFDTCKNKRNLPFDFYLPEYNILIEVQGQFHEERLRKGIFGKHKLICNQTKTDLIKQKWCRENNIKLIHIWWYDIRQTKNIIKDMIRGEKNGGKKMEISL